MSHTCPVCAYPKLSEPPRSKSGGGSYEICPSCGFEFGVSDDDLGHTYESWRQAWQAGGMKWSSRGQKQPAAWNPAKQLSSLISAKPVKAAAKAPVKKTTSAVGTKASAATAAAKKATAKK
ncbi:hypothetical protein LBMAG56_25140 [Verrucomicrobiota bacterium]|nr:hypothetical protein LBMAG56_25140 [Verrucomicrobiota bacterium]